jgi:hypothetical protein
LATFLDYDPERGVEQWQAIEDGNLKIHTRQDVEPLLDLTAIERNNGLTDYGIKKDLWLYARIPPVVILELKYKYGVDIFKKDHLKRALTLINTEYPYLKCTEKTHSIRN